jgi:hypothetical protein
MHPESSRWFIRDEYIARMQEHELYTQQLLNFYENVTMFPNVQLMNESPPASAVFARCKAAMLKD